MVLINTLPDLCLVIIFKNLPLNDQLRLGFVCTRWNSLQPVVTRRRTSLTVLVNTPGYHVHSTFKIPHIRVLVKEDGSPLFPARPISEWNSLKLSYFNTDSIRGLVAAYPRLTTLSIVVECNDASVLILLAQLFQELASTLVTL